MAEDQTPATGTAEPALSAAAEPVPAATTPTPAEAAPRAVNKGIRALAAGYLGVFGFLLTAGVALALFGSASDGSPMVSLAIAPRAEAPRQGEAETKAETQTQGPARPASLVKTRVVSGYLVADPALIENSPEGPLPAVASDGRTPMTAYAQTLDGDDKRPKIAIVIQGLGVGANATDLALKSLPPQVTLAYVPFVRDPQTAVDKARGAGHEVLLQVPMEPFDFPDSDPGPHALLIAASAEENIKRLHWSMSRVTGYVGIASLLGGRFLGEAGAIEPMLAEVAKRGLVFFDGGASPRSLAGTGAGHVGATLATAALVLDGVQTPAAIDGKLLQLETQARQDGSAIAVASAYPVTISRVGEWAAGAAARGFRLVTITSLAVKPKMTASASAR